MVNAPTPAQTTVANLAYPKALADAERSLHKSTRVGVALSGGGIRSATFALGVFQAIARLRLLKRIDYLSTVSGGGYFGAFLGRLFSRPYVQTADDVEAILTGPHYSNVTGAKTRAQARWKVLGWLRENGRYLSPRGAGDTLLGAVVLFRNWASVHVVLGMLFFAAFLLLQLPRVLTRNDTLHSGAIGATIGGVLDLLPLSGGWLWWSPWILLALLVLGFFSAPLCWSYWLAPTDRYVGHGNWIAQTSRAWQAIAVALMLGVIAVPARWYGWADGPNSPDEGFAHVTYGSAIVAGTLGLLSAIFYYRALGLAPGHRVRHKLSVWLLRSLVAAGVIAAIALIDSVAQTLYVVVFNRDGATVKQWSAVIAGAFAALSAAARQIAVLMGGKTDGKRPRLPTSIVAGAIASVLVVAILTGFALLSHGVAWEFGPPNPPEAFRRAESGGVVTLSAPASTTIVLTSQPGPPAAARSGQEASVPLFLAWLIGAALLARAFGRAFTFLNNSSHQTMYGDRLIRAYLGASNPERWDTAKGRLTPVVTPIEGDDIEVHEYWPPPDGESPARVYEKGMPLHLINVTVNETFDGQSQVQQQDRKGTGMALGPAGMSLGIRHHVVIKATTHERHRHVEIDEVLPAGDDYKAFSYDVSAQTSGGHPKEFPWEPLSLGRWVGISGAAFSTGIGYRTSLGLSLLAGLANVRLGYWWDSGIERRLAPARKKPDGGAAAQGHQETKVAETAGARLWYYAFARWFPVQSYLLSEFVARFPGTSQRNWYLSDGGHFENMGAYELIRRRLPVIVVIDAEADADYQLEGLSNLVRKARLDFQADIRFLDDVALAAKGLSTPFGSLDQVRAAAAADAKAGKQAAKQAPRSAARCAFAEIRYAQNDQPVPCSPESVPADGWLLYIKPVLMGDEPADVLQYAQMNVPFPQQTTADQFFDEAQWESYRRLGELTGCQVFEAARNAIPAIQQWSPELADFVTPRIDEKPLDLTPKD